jgi:hypothetical protein
LQGIAAAIVLCVAAVVAEEMSGRDTHPLGSRSPAADSPHLSDHAPLASMPATLPSGGSPKEAQLRALETQRLGPEHAAEHAIARELARRQARFASPSGMKRTLAVRDSSALDDRTTAPAAPAVKPDPAVVGRWTPKFPIPSVAVHAVMLATGKVLYFTGPSIGHAYLLDPVTHTTENVDPPSLPGQSTPANIFCAGQSLLADGRVLIVGGTLDFRVGLKTIFTFDPFTKTWTRHPDMRHGRWYPSQVLLADGRTAVLDGLDERGQPYTNPDLGVYDPASDSVDLAAERGTPGQPPTGGLYPHLFLMPSGRVLVAGPQRQDSWFFESRAGDAFSWEDAPDLATRRTWASGVLMPGGTEGSSRVELIGGADYEALLDSGTSTPLASTEIFDEQNPGAGWTAGPSLNVARAHQNTVLLPDGSMATVGGGYGILSGDRRTGDPALHRQIELYDRASDSWRLGPPEDELRTYHSTALLLPDARVLSAGDDVNGGSTSDTGEIYEPPYLFKGPRPTIESAPSTIGHGSTFTVRTPDHVAKAVLIAPGAVTHANDMNQRYIPLNLSQRADGKGVDLVAPASPNVAPPGYYMLFLLSDDGVPSVAKFVRLTIPPKPATIEADPAAPLTLEEVTLTATAGEGGVPSSRVDWDLDADGSFDDGTSNPIKTTFASPGPHVVRVRLTDGTGASSASVRVLTVGNRPPTASIGFSPSMPLSLEPVSFSASAADVDGAIAAPLWDLDDDGAFDDGIGSEVVRSFPRKGSYVVSVRVTDNLGASATAAATVGVANTPPRASFDYSPLRPAPLQPVTFTSTSSDRDGTITSMSWDMDEDGSFDDGVDVTVTRSYANPGIYAVRLRVTDNDGDVTVASASVSVSEGQGHEGLDGAFAPALGGSPPGPESGTMRSPSRLERVLSRKRATSSAKRALTRRYGRTYAHATNRKLSCKRRSRTAFRCRYSFQAARSRRCGLVQVAQRGTRITSRVQPVSCQSWAAGAWHRWPFL